MVRAVDVEEAGEEGEEVAEGREGRSSPISSWKALGSLSIFRRSRRLSICPRIRKTTEQKKLQYNPLTLNMHEPPLLALLLLDLTLLAQEIPSAQPQPLARQRQPELQRFG